jgi:aspartate racemase
MVPLHYIGMDEIPLTPNGKVDVAALPKAELYTAKAREYVAPRTSSEELAVSIWSAILGQAEVSVQDNFFEIGGNSLLATQIVSQAKAQFQCNIPLRILFEYPVLSEWVEQIEQIKMIELATGAEVDSEKCIVKIQQKGDQLPLFFVHPVGGTITCYFTLARQLGEDQPFYAIQGHGMIYEDSTLDTVEDMADHYIKEILEVQPHGPYRLGGWSMGGFIAYEIAKKLKEAGHEVIQLVLIDSYLSRTRDVDDETILYNFVRQLAAVPDKSISDSTILSWKNVNLDDESLCIELKALDLLPSGTSTQELRRLINVYKNTVYAFNKYDPAPDYKLDIDHVQLFRAEDSPEEEGVWTHLVNNLSLKHVIADHFSIVHNPDIGKIADIYKTNSFMVKR